jgi:hypothetical protein
VGGTVDVVVVVVGGTEVAVTLTTGASAIVTGAGRPTGGRSAPWVRTETGPPPGDTAGRPADGWAGVAEASPLLCRATRGAASSAAHSTNATARR